MNKMIKITVPLDPSDYPRRCELCCLENKPQYHSNPPRWEATPSSHAWACSPPRRGETLAAVITSLTQKNAKLTSTHLSESRLLPLVFILFKYYNSQAEVLGLSLFTFSQYHAELNSSFPRFLTIWF